MELVQQAYDGIVAIAADGSEVSLSVYIGRMQRYAGVREHHLAAAVRYDGLLRERTGADKSLVLLGMCCMLATKFWDDETLLNSYWAKIIGISPSDVNAYEQWVLEGIQYDLYDTTAVAMGVEG